MSSDNETAIRRVDWTSRKRTQIIQTLQEREFDIVIVGGGITGAGIAREAELRGLDVALVDKNDFAWGTSSRSTKMAHGGFRYLSNGEFSIVRESTTERNWLRNHLPNLVRPVHFIFPCYADKKDSRRVIKIGTWLYDLLSNAFSKFKNYAKHEALDAEEVARAIPTLRTEHLEGGSSFYDTNVDDSRLTLETIKEAVFLGAVALNYARVDEFVHQDGLTRGVRVTDRETGDQFEVRGKQVVLATGIWTDELLPDHDQVIRPTKGVHIQYPRENFQLDYAVAMRNLTDNRAYFVIPRNDIVLVGTTDTDYEGDFDACFTTKEDWDYLVESTRHYFPDVDMSLDQVISTYAGIRPLVREPGKSESSVSRKHTIIDTPDGLVTIAGGKLTTFRKMAEEMLLHLRARGVFPQLSKKKNLSKRPYLVGATREAWDREARAFPDVPADVKAHLYQQYGWGGIAIMEFARDDPALADRLVDHRPFIYAEIRYIVEHELAVHLVDVLCRRTEVMLRVHPRHHEQIATRAAAIMGEFLGLDAATQAREVKDHLTYVDKNAFFLHVDE